MAETEKQILLIDVDEKRRLQLKEMAEQATGRPAACTSDLG